MRKRIRYSIAALIALVTLAGVAAFLQLRITQNITKLTNEIRDPRSPMHRETNAEHSAMQIRITAKRTNATATEVLFFRRRIEYEYDIITTKYRREIAHSKIRNGTGEFFVEVPYSSQTNHTLNATVGPFGFNADN